MTPELHVYYSKKKASIIGSVVFLYIILAYLLLFDDYVIIPGNSSFDNVSSFDVYFSLFVGICSLIVSVVVPIIAIVLILRKSPVFSITQKGIIINKFQNYHSVSWEQVSGVLVQRQLFMKNVLVFLKEPELYIKALDQRMSGYKLKTGTLTMNMQMKKTGTPLVLSTLLLSSDAEEIFARYQYLS